MFKSYLTIAWRHLTRHTFFSVVNMLCLAIGITFSLFIGIYVFQQYGINQSLKNADDQYILKSEWKVKEMGIDITTYGPLAKALKDEYPSLVAGYYRYDPVTNVVSAGDKHFKEDIAIGDTSFLSMYGFPVLYGNKEQPFADNNSAVITETMAVKLFGKPDATGKLISILTTVNGKAQDYKVSAVVKDIPRNSVTHLLGDTYSVFVPAAGNNYFSGGDPLQDWNGAYIISAIQLTKGTHSEQLDLPIQQVLSKHIPGDVRKNLRVRPAPVKSYYLHDNNNAVLKMTTALSLAALFILLMAVINFVNISIGTSAYRLKEIGLRKVFGGEKKQLVIQFITEALILTVAAAFISLILYQLLRSVFGQILNTTFESLFQFDGQTLFYLLVLVLLTGLTAGVYPAFVLSSAKVVNAVKGRMETAQSSLIFRKGMLVVQFALATLVLTGSLIVSQQVSFIFSKDTGYSKDQLLILSAFPKQWDSAGTLAMTANRDALSQVPGVKDVSLSFEIPDRKPPGSVDMQAVNGDNRTVLIASCAADKNYAATFGLKMLSGACFAQSGGFTPNQIVLNESAARALGFTASSAVNRQVRTPSSPGTLLTIAGVFKDYNYSNLQESIQPIALFNVNDWVAYRYLSIKLNTTNIAETIARIRSKWKTLSPNAPFEYTFMDDKFQALYQSELQLKKASSTATVLAIVIVLLGIVGLVSLSIQKRTKEIGIRKVLGSSVQAVVYLFIKEFLWLMIMAGFIACPLAYWVMSQWLQAYAYRINITPLPFLVAVLCLGMVTVLVIGMQTIKTAIMNPVKSLRNE